ncbi:hypothetical protein V6N00_12945 [Tersicoccus sp. MR15.9]|uniref:tripartite tricarboxylate transporter TctB family protein n=1 Tax=Tersicoccus mangrovi TaxID=3121635 RepID=UPI002FE661C5
MKTLISRLGALVLILAVLLIGGAGTATAAITAPATALSAPRLTPAPNPNSGNVTSGSSSACGVTSTSPISVAKSDLLPVNRWTDATAKMQSNLDNTFAMATAQKVQRDWLISSQMGLGNMMWNLSTSWASSAINFCVLNSAGGAVDTVVATIGNAIIHSPLLAGLVVIAVIGLLWSGFRRGGGRPWKALLMKGAVVALLVAMVTGASASTGGGKGDSGNPYDSSAAGNYKPGVMSPGWMVTKLNSVVSSLASLPAAALTLPAVASSNGQATADVLSCENYTAQMRNEYVQRYGGASDQSAAAVPVTLNDMWTKTGLQAWRNAQFGTNGLDDASWCRLLEMNASSQTITPGSNGEAVDANTSGTVRSIMNRVLGSGYGMHTTYETQAFQPTSNEKTERSLIGWAACQLKDRNLDPRLEGSWQIRPAFAEGDKDHKATEKDCASWWTTVGDDLGAFGWPNHMDDLVKRTTTSNMTAALHVRDFVGTLNGNLNNAGFAAGSGYLISSLAILAVFGLMSLAIVAAKIFVLVLILGLFFAALMALLPGAGFEKVTKAFTALLGVIFFTFGAQLLLAVITIMTSILQTVGASFMGGAGSLADMVWTGLSPVIAVILMHLLFTKILKIASPFKISGGLAWAGAAGAAGGAAAHGLGSLMDRGQNRATRAVKGAASRGGKSALSAATGGRFGGPRKGKAGLATDGAGQKVSAENTGPSTGRKGKAKDTLLNPENTSSTTTENAAGVGEGVGAAAAVAATAGSASAATKARKGRAAADAAGRAMDAGASHEDLLNSDVANSQLGRGKMSGAERQAMAGLAKDERAAAQAWADDRDASLGIKPGWEAGAFNAAGAGIAGAAGMAATAVRHPVRSVQATGAAMKNVATAVPGFVRTAGSAAKTAGSKAWQGTMAEKDRWSSVPKAAARAGQLAAGGAKGGWKVTGKALTAARYSNAMDQFRAKPFKTSAKIAGAGLLLAATAPAPFIPAAIGAGYVGKKLLGEAKKRTVARKRISDAQVADYRSAMQAERDRREAAAKKAALQAEKAANETEKEQETGPADSGTGETERESSSSLDSVARHLEDTSEASGLDSVHRPARGNAGGDHSATAKIALAGALRPGSVDYARSGATARELSGRTIGGEAGLVLTQAPKATINDPRES